MHSLLTTTTAYYVENDACMLNQIINTYYLFVCGQQIRPQKNLIF